MIWLMLVIISVMVFGCSPPQMEKAKVAKKSSEKVISMDEAVGGLPCFKCHSYTMFTATPQRGLFAHAPHLKTGYHCSQCHDFRAHKHITVDMNVCGNCHGIKMIAFNKTVMPSRFNHESHAKIAGCKDCHPHIFLMKAGSAHVTMKDINNGAYCGACHNGKKAFASSECRMCHETKKFDKDLTYKVEGVGNVVFSHKFHSSLFSCDECHPKHFAIKRTQGKMKMDDMYAGKLCGACHNGNIASPVTECSKCHIP